jgi:DNA-directed RNA polymerase beta subunit
MTPINNNVNLQNSLTVSTHITDDKVLFDVYDKNFQKITIEYIDYLNSKVCASEYVDYDNLQLKPNFDNMVEVKYRMKRKMVPVEEIDLVDLHPDYRLSSTSRRIPFINYTDSVRISMGTSILIIKYRMVEKS